MAWQEAIQTLGWLTEKSKKPKKQTSGRAWKIEDTRVKIAETLQNWVTNDLKQTAKTDKIVTVIGAFETKISLHYSNKLIGGRSFYIATIDRDEIKKQVLAAAALVKSGNFDDEIKRIFEEAKAGRLKASAQRRAK